MIFGFPQTSRVRNMSFMPFDLEYTQSLWEQKVDINLTESGVHPIRLDELLGDDEGMLARAAGD